MKNTMKNSDNPWIEAYRPQSLKDVKGQEKIVMRLQRWVKAIKDGNRSMPNLLFAGRVPGIGKTTVAKAFMRDVFGEWWEQNWLYLNASDDRGIKVVRETIKNFARTVIIPDEKLGRVFNVIFLDEAEYLTSEAQAALRAMMEDLSGTCRFILACNYLSKIIEPIRNRCLGFRFKPLSDAAIIEIINSIAKAEDIEIEPAAFLRIAEGSRGSARYAINMLNDLSLQPTGITKDDVAEVVPQVCTEDARNLLKTAMTAPIKKLDGSVIELYDEGYTAEEIFDAIYELLIESEIPGKTVRKMLARMMDVEYYIASGCNELRQLRGFFIWLSIQAKKAAPA